MVGCVCLKKKLQAYKPCLIAHCLFSGPDSSTQEIVTSRYEHYTTLSDHRLLTKDTAPNFAGPAIKSLMLSCIWSNVFTMSL